jgi:hypothetical protein
MFKYFSNSIISLMISFMLIFPLVVSLEGMVFTISDDNINKDIYKATDYGSEAERYNFKMISKDWKSILLEALTGGGGVSKKWTVGLDNNGGLRVTSEIRESLSGSGALLSSTDLIRTGDLMKSAYWAFFFSSFILIINVISIIAGTKAISTLMDEEESLMEMFIKVV